MLSVVTLAPHAQGTLHHHPEEQWGVLLDGSAIRVQGDEEIPVKKGDFWRTPGNVPHTMRAGPEGARVLDIFSPPRPNTRRPDRASVINKSATKRKQRSSNREESHEKITRRTLLAASAAFAAAPALAQSAKITLVVPFPPGGSTDALARLLQSHLQTRLGRVVLVENKSGAAGSLGAAQVAKSPPDVVVSGDLRFARGDSPILEKPGRTSSRI